MSVAVQSSTQASGTSNPSTFSHNNVSGNVLVFMAFYKNGNILTGITYAGVAMTRAITGNRGSNAYSSIWYLANPATGANTVSVSYSVTANTGQFMAVSLTDGDTTTPVNETATENNGTSTIVDANLTTTADDVLHMAVGESPRTYTSTRTNTTLLNTSASQEGIFIHSTSNIDSAASEIGFNMNLAIVSHTTSVGFNTGGGSPPASQNSSFLKFM